MPAYAFKSSLQGRGVVTKGTKRKSSDNGVSQPPKRSNVKVGPVNEPSEAAKPKLESDSESPKKKKYVEVTTLEKLQDVEQILLDLQSQKRDSKLSFGNHDSES